MRTLEKSHSLRCRLSSERVEANVGVIRGCTVAEANVQAIGKFVFVDAKNQITHDEKLAVKKLPVYTDEKTLDTLMAAAAAASGRVKTREDHNDAVGARAGFTDSFRKTTDGRVVGDVHLFDSYKNRATVIETATKTPDEIGLSIDMIPEFEVLPDRVLMRIKTLEAVDIVDAGAITPGGLLLSAVDTRRNSEASPSEPLHTMATEPTINDLMSTLTAHTDAMSKLSDGYAAIQKQLSDHAAALSKLMAPPAKPDKPAAGEPDGDEMKKSMGALTEKMSALTQQVSQMKREKALLGFRGTPEQKVALAAASAEDIEKLTATRKPYLQMVRDARDANKQLSASAAHDVVRRTAEGRIAYDEHLMSKGITKASAAV